MKRILGVLLLLAACGDNMFIDHEEPYYFWHGQTQVGAINIDGLDASDDAVTLGDFEKAKANRDAMMLYAHIPGETVAPETIEAMLAHARDLDMPYLTFADLAASDEPRAGLCLSFDDGAIDQWFTLRDLFAKYGVHVTFFITRYTEFTDDGKAKLHQLAAEGHDIEAHGVDHVHGPAFVEQYGMQAYIDQQIQPSIDVLRADGYHPVAFAHPFGERTEAIDDALLPLFKITRGIATVRK